MEKIRTALLRVLQQMRLSDDDHAELSGAIHGAGSRAELSVLIAELQDRAGDDLDAIAHGLQAGGSVTEAARIRAEARQAHAPMEKLARQAGQERA